MVVFRVRGVPIRVGWSWLVIVALVYWSLASVLFPDSYPHRATWVYLTMAAVGTVLLFASLLLHELSHTLQSLREGVRIKDITLFLFGGVSEADEPIPSPGAEFRVVAAGPLASAALMVFFAAAALVADAAGAAAVAVGVLAYLARINGLLLVFNLVPALPLDGGRLLHAWLWRRSGDHETATLRAAGAGRAFAVFLISLGAVVLLVGDSVGGVWLVAIGWFLMQAVRQEVLAAQAAQAFTGRRVRDLMGAPVVALEPTMTIQQLADRLDDLSVHAAYPVVDGGRFLGLLVLHRAGQVDERLRSMVLVSDVMVPASRVVVLHPDDEVLDAARSIASTAAGAPAGTTPVPAVVLGGESGQELIGVLSPTDLERAVAAGPLQGGPPPGRANGSQRRWSGRIPPRVGQHRA